MDTRTEKLILENQNAIMGMLRAADMHGLHRSLLNERIKITEQRLTEIVVFEEACRRASREHRSTPE